MAYSLKDWTLDKVGVIGSGQIGPDIALFFTKVLAPHDVPIVVVDVSEDALAKGRAKLEKKISKGVESGAFKPEHAEAMMRNLSWTTDYSALKGARLVIEAATEDKNIKQKIVAQLESVVADDCIIASNSSHMEPEVIFENAKTPEHTLVIHYFFPAERNIIVEIVPSKHTHKPVVDWLMAFYEEIGKAPIKVGSRYGYAIDPVFEGLFQAAALLAEKGLGSVKQVDVISQKALGQGIGPFTAMNLTGGNPITAVGLDHYTTKIHKWFRTPASLKEKVETNQPWETAGRGEKVEYTEDQFRQIADYMTGAYFGLVGEIVDAGISNVGGGTTLMTLSDVSRLFRHMYGSMSIDSIHSSRFVTSIGNGSPGCHRSRSNSSISAVPPSRGAGSARFTIITGGGSGANSACTPLS